jgi:hypothetical protein
MNIRLYNEELVRRYHLVAISEKDGWKEYLTSYPMTHKECCVMKARFSLGRKTQYPARRIQLEDA